MAVLEWFKQSKLIVRIVAICGIIFVLFGLVYGMYWIFRGGTGDLSGQVIKVTKAVYDDYDDKMVDASDVTSAIKKYIDANMTIVVANIGNQGGTFGTESFQAPNYCVMVDQEHNAGSPIETPSGTVYTSKISYDSSTSRWYIGEFGNDNRYGLDWSGDAWLRNTNYRATENSNVSQCSIVTGTKWRANLLYDPTNDTVCGVLFRQIK